MALALFVTNTSQNAEELLLAMRFFKRSKYKKRNRKLSITFPLFFFFAVQCHHYASIHECLRFDYWTLSIRLIKWQAWVQMKKWICTRMSQFPIFVPRAASFQPIHGLCILLWDFYLALIRPRGKPTLLRQLSSGTYFVDAHLPSVSPYFIGKYFLYYWLTVP